MTTAISPSVSRPRKSTMMTLTMLRPWAIALRMCAEEVAQRARRTAAASTLQQQQPEAEPAGDRDRRRRAASASAGRRSAGDSLSRVITSARMTTDSVSTMNWVKDRSGAPSSRKSSATAKPWMPSETIAVSRLLARAAPRRGRSRRCASTSPFMQQQRRPGRAARAIRRTAPAAASSASAMTMKVTVMIDVEAAVLQTIASADRARTQQAAQQPGRSRGPAPSRSPRAGRPSARRAGAATR